MRIGEMGGMRIGEMGGMKFGGDRWNEDWGGWVE